MDMESKDHSGMAMEGMDHSGMAMKGKGHSGMAMEGMNHSGMAMEGKSHSGMDMEGMDHSGMSMGGKNPSSGPPAVAAPLTASPGQPARTLTSDPLDAPAASSVLDAQRSAAMAQEMSGGMSGMEGHGGGTYRQLDAGRDPGAHGQAPPPPGQEPEHSHPPASAAHEEAAVYTCPMHPGVTATAPGECPKCGMTLVNRRQG
jgi:hypothetical protein